MVFSVCLKNLEVHSFNKSSFETKIFQNVWKILIIINKKNFPLESSFYYISVRFAFQKKVASRSSDAELIICPDIFLYKTISYIFI